MRYVCIVTIRDFLLRLPSIHHECTDEYYTRRQSNGLEVLKTTTRLLALAEADGVLRLLHHRLL